MVKVMIMTISFVMTNCSKRSVLKILSSIQSSLSFLYIIGLICNWKNGALMLIFSERPALHEILPDGQRIGKEKHKKNDAVVRALFVNKYKDLIYCLPAQSENDIDRIYVIREEDIVWCQGKDGGWTIFGQCEDPLVEEDKITPFLAVTLICNTVQTEGIQILHPDPGLPDWEVYNPDIIS